MAHYQQLRVEAGEKGLNLARRQDELQIGEAAVANNVEFFINSVSKRHGYVPILTGNLDACLYGGPSSQSIGVVGEERGLEPVTRWRGVKFVEDTPPLGFAQDRRRDFFNQRPGIIVIPEGQGAIATALRLNVRDADPSWAFEICLRAEELPLYQAGGATGPIMVTIPIQKGQGTTGQWAVRILQDGTSDRFYAALTLYVNGQLGTAGGLVGNPTTPQPTVSSDFFYNSGAERAWIEPGKRVWLAWKFIKGNPGVVTSYYWIEGATSVVSSSQNSDYVSANIRSSGVGAAVLPITIGRRPFQAAGRAGIPNADVKNQVDEMGFTGSIAELRLWYDSAQGAAGTLELPSNWASVTAYPPAAADWYVESEIPREQLTTDASLQAGNLVQSSDLGLYFQFRQELVGTDPLGNSLVGENDRFVRPRFTRGSALDNNAWLAGADATWLAGSGALGSPCLGLLPAATTANQHYAFADVIRSGQTNSFHGKRLFGGGIRIPNAASYVFRDTTGASPSFEWTDQFSLRIPVRCDGLDPTHTFPQTIAEINSVQRGTGPNFDRYGLSSIFRLAVIWDGAAWRFQLLFRDATGIATTINSTTTTVTEGVIYVVQAAIRFESGNRIMSLFVNGARENTDNAVHTKPWVSQTSFTDSAFPNQDDQDGRDQCFPFFIGCSVETPINVDSHPDPFAFRFGAYGIGGGAEIGKAGANRSYWAWATNDTKKTVDDGIGYRGGNPFVGAIGNFQVWHKYPSESEARALATRGPSGEEMQRDGALLLSNWQLTEGLGTRLADAGYLKNHLLINPFPNTFAMGGACHRVDRPPLLGIWQKRQISNIGAPTNEIYALSNGVVQQLLKDANGNPFLKNIGRAPTPEMWEPATSSPRLPTAFQFNGSLHICTGLGPVKRVQDGRVSDLGLTPVFGDKGDDQTNLGWREFDRDGTFQIYESALAGGSPATFPINNKYGWAVTFYDPDSGLESAPSRLMFIQVSNAWAGVGNGVNAWTLQDFPHSPQPQAAKMRIYRTPANSGTFQFVAEVSTETAVYGDTTADTNLGFTLQSWLNYPPPQNARIGLAFGTRVLYTGVLEHPDTLYYSLQGQAGAVPKQYQITIASGRSTEITGAVVINDRAFIFTRTSTFAVFDSGGDIAIDSQDLPPVQLYQLRDGVGCISHHGIVNIEGVGAVVPTERGLFLFDGTNFRNIGGEREDRIQPFWETLNLDRAKSFVAIANRRKKQYILFCSTSCSPDDYNDRALVWDWGRDAFAIQTQRDVLYAQNIVDENSGQERVWITTSQGNVFEFDPPDVNVFADAPVTGTFSGTVLSALKDTNGSGKYVRLTLVSDFSLPTAGDGLRGCNLYTTNYGVQWHTVPLKILWNDANSVLIDATAANSTDPTSQEWRLGAIGANWTSGKMNFGSDVQNLRVLRVQANLSPAPGSTLTMQCAYDEQVATSAFVDPSKEFAILSGISGRGKRAFVRFHDITRYGGLPNNHWELSRYEIDWQARGRATYVPS